LHEISISKKVCHHFQSASRRSLFFPELPAQEALGSLPPMPLEAREGRRDAQASKRVRRKICDAQGSVSTDDP
jgi:hypothetical protein